MRSEYWDSRSRDQYPVDDDQDGRFGSLDGDAEQLPDLQDPNSRISGTGEMDALHGEGDDYDDDADENEGMADEDTAAPDGMEADADLDGDLLDTAGDGAPDGRKGASAAGTARGSAPTEASGR